MSDQGIPSPYLAQANAAASANGIPQSIFSALVSQESSWDPYAIGKAGEIGLTQLMPSTAAQLGGNAYDPTSNLNMGAAYLSSLFKKYGDWTSALSAYNSGSPNSAAGLQYAKSILGNANYAAANAAPGQPQQTGIIGATVSGWNAITSFIGKLMSLSFWETAGIYLIGIIVLLFIGFMAIKNLFNQGTAPVPVAA